MHQGSLLARRSQNRTEGDILSLVPRLLGDRRFVDAGQLVERFRSDVGHWRAGTPVKALIEDANELATC